MVLLRTAVQTAEPRGSDPISVAEPSHASSSTATRAPRGAFYLGLLICVGLYWTNLSGGFLSDDFWWVDAVRRFGANAFWVSGSRFFRPQASFEFWLFDKIGNGQPWVQHVFVMAFFLGSAVLIRRIIVQIASGWDSGSRVEWTATTAGLIFAFYPSHCEPVNWICCTCDTAGMFEGLLGISLFLSYSRSTGFRKVLWFFATLVALALAMTSKEVFLLIPAIVIVIELFFVRERTAAAKVGQLLLFGLTYALLVGLYLTAHNMLHNGWGYAGQLSESRLTLERNITYDIPNAFLPFTEWIGRYSDSLVLWPTAILGIVCLAFALRRTGTAPVPRNSGLKRVYEWFGRHKMMLFTAWAVLNYYVDFFWLGDPVLALQFGCVAALFGIVAWKYRLYRLSWLVAILFVASCAFFVNRENLVLYELFHVPAVLTIGKGKVASLMVLLYAYSTRPPSNGLNREERRWVALALLFCVTAGFLLLPGMTVGYVYMDGQGERLAYESTPFAVMAVACMMAFFLREKPRRLLGVAGVYLALLGVGLFFNNAEWAYAGQVSNNVIAGLEKVAASHPRRIYMICSIAFNGSAQLFNNGDDDMLASFQRPGSFTSIRSGYQEIYHLPGDKVTLASADFKRKRFVLRVVEASYRSRLEPNDLGARGTGITFGWYESPRRGEIWLRGFKPGDRIVYVEDDHLKVLL